ncbi:MAG: hypothetical protein GY915_00785 [bacterium]|jgi:hypothetical protein|nr:hypothetical protein [bacterium]
MTRKEQIHAALYNAAVDAGFMLTALPETATIIVDDLLEKTPQRYEVTFTGTDISDMDVHITTAW